MADGWSPLIDARELRARIGDRALRIADVRWYLADAEGGRNAYAGGHLPGAIFVDLDRDLSAASGPGRHPLPDPAELARRLGAMGIGDGHEVVAYDDVGGTVAARLWWMLDVLGHSRAAVLDGGLGAWQRTGGELTTEVPDHPPAVLRLASAWPETLDREAVAARIASIDLVDLRAAERYRGEVEPIDPVAGHIPGARNRAAAELLDADGTLLPPRTLATRLREGARTDDGPMVMSCGSGVTACFGILAARVAGLPEPFLYPGSYSDWSTAGMPVATGDAPDGPRNG